LLYLHFILQDPIEQLLIFHLAGCDGKTYAGDHGVVDEVHSITIAQSLP
jgi:hypothetical protein